MSQRHRGVVSALAILLLISYLVQMVSSTLHFQMVDHALSPSSGHLACLESVGSDHSAEHTEDHAEHSTHESEPALAAGLDHHDLLMHDCKFVALNRIRGLVQRSVTPITATLPPDLSHHRVPESPVTCYNTLIYSIAPKQSPPGGQTA
jgi:hypothetical protein